jgi:hypothetical protein
MSMETLQDIAQLLIDHHIELPNKRCDYCNYINACTAWVCSQCGQDISEKGWSPVRSWDFYNPAQY